MEPKIDKSSFGAITIAGEKYNHDVMIRLDQRIKKRKKKLSKELYGTSHIISLAEAEHIYEPGAERLIVGSGQFGMVKLSLEADAFFKGKACLVELLPTPQAIQRWNEARDKVIAVFHITC